MRTSSWCEAAGSPASAKVRADGQHLSYKDDTGAAPAEQWDGARLARVLSATSSAGGRGERRHPLRMRRQSRLMLSGVNVMGTFAPVTAPAKVRDCPIPLFSQHSLRVLRKVNAAH
jgi:hypothetical protein